MGVAVGVGLATGGKVAVLFGTGGTVATGVKGAMVVGVGVTVCVMGTVVDISSVACGVGVMMGVVVNVGVTVRRGLSAIVHCQIRA